MSDVVHEATVAAVSAIAAREGVTLDAEAIAVAAEQGVKLLLELVTGAIHARAVASAVPAAATPEGAVADLRKGPTP